MKRFFWLDERTERLNGRISFVVLVLLQAALALTVAFKRYVQGLDPAHYTDFSLILLASILLYGGARLYLSGILPVISWRGMLALYVGTVALIAIPSALIHGLPSIRDWQTTLLPATLGPAAVLIVYWLIAYLGKRRLERQIE